MSVNVIHSNKDRNNFQNVKKKGNNDGKVKHTGISPPVYFLFSLLQVFELLYLLDLEMLIDIFCLQCCHCSVFPTTM